MDHLQCINGKCVHKSKFCDRANDCGDYSDEPPRCTCRAYLKLTYPNKVCDGHINCHDGSDEAPTMCQCKADDFVCPMWVVDEVVYSRKNAIVNSIFQIEVLYFEWDGV